MSQPLRLRVLVAVILVAPVLGCIVHRRPPPPPPSARESIETWERRHPAASQDLGNWVRGHDRAAGRFFTWDSRHPGAAEAFVSWSLANPRADIDEFAETHRSWDDFNWIMEHHRPAANSFMAWCRRHPEASRELMHYPAGLHWAGTHLYEGYWRLEGPGE